MVKMNIVEVLEQQTHIIQQQAEIISEQAETIKHQAEALQQLGAVMEGGVKNDGI